MTTEIAVINRLGIALATDSAVTISGGDEPKVFDNGDKLFELCEHCPVGIMINGNMDFLGVPWELMIKDFRARAHECAPGAIRDWLQAFLDDAAKHKALSSRSEARYIAEVILAELEGIKARVQQDLFRSQDDEPSISKTIDAVVKRRLEYYGRHEKADSLKGLKHADLVARYGKVVDKLVVERFAPVELTAAQKNNVRRLLWRMLLSRAPSGASTGMIVAGFGDSDMFPSLSVAEVDGVVAGKIKYSWGEQRSVDREKYRGGVISFAQTDVIDRILGGADERFIEKTAKFFDESFDKSKPLLLKVLEKSGMGTDEASKAFDDITRAVTSRYRSSFAPKTKTDFQREFEDMVAMMPKQDSIELAEALISITSIERKASSQQETVGGPVDVAFITRHDGFVWIKRKHYFDPRLNPRYFRRKFGPKGPSEAEDGAADT